MGFLDWQPAMEKLFEVHVPERILEWGMGEGTRWFLDRGCYVRSIEFGDVANPNNTIEWYQKCREWYKENDHWDSDLWEWNPAQDLSKSIGVYDLIFVDPSRHERGTIVNACWWKAPIIVAHDWNTQGGAYDWQVIVKPIQYQQVVRSDGEGTCFFIHSALSQVAAHLIGS